MKKLLSLILSVLVVVSAFGGCASEKEDVSSGEKGTTQEQAVSGNVEQSEVLAEAPKLQKFTERAGAGTVFSEGLAIVSNGSTTYCINKNGEIVYTALDEYKPNANGYYTRGYENGYVMIGENLYDKTGKITKPSDLGVTKFYDYALAGGYIVAVKEESTYNSAKFFLGVLNTDFDWVVPLSEELYNSAFGMTRPTMYASAVDGYIFDENSGYVFEVATSKIYTFNDAPEGLGADRWTIDNNPFTPGRLEGEWIDGKRVMSIYNSEAQKYFFTLVDGNGDFQFEPVELPLNTINNSFAWDYDGRYIVAIQETSDYVPVFVYETTNGTSYTTTNKISGNIRLSDGVIACYGSLMYASFDVDYYDLQLNPLY